jgi:hypothetical protein
VASNHTCGALKTQSVTKLSRPLDTSIP